MLKQLDKLTLNQGINKTNIDEFAIFKVNHPYSKSAFLMPPTICLIAQGEKSVFFGGKEYRYNKESYLVASNKLPIEMQLFTASPKKPYYGLVFSVDPLLLSNLLINLEGYKRWEEIEVTEQVIDSTPMTQGVWKSAERLINIINDPMDIKVLKESLLKELYYEVLKGPIGHILRNTVLNHSKAHRIVPVLKYLEEHYQEHLTIDDIAKNAGMSHASLHAHFKSITSLSPLQFLKLYRLHNARNLIISGKTIGRAAFQSGYKSQAQFSREFKRLFGQTPSEVKAEN